MKRLFVVASLVLLTGCVGLAAGTYGKHKLAKSEFGLSAERNEFSFTSATYSTDEVQQLWGEPDAIDSHGACTVYGYKKGRSWSGAGLFVGVAPIPLVVPSGNYWNYLYFVDGKTVGAIVEYGEVKNAVGATCGSNECGGIAGDAGNAIGDAEADIARWCAV